MSTAPVPPPQVAVTWGTTLLSDRPRPDTLKLRKRVTAWPLEFTFKVGACRHAPAGGRCGGGV